MIDTNGITCCGCGACAQICPQNCIGMQENNEGFLYPVIHAEKCIQCRLCENVCPVLNPINRRECDLNEAWGGYCKDQSLLLTSSSGGIFSVLAQQILTESGCVYGAAFTEDFGAVRHIEVEATDDLQLLCGSKYMQSELGSSFLSVRKSLEQGRRVLFSGTPCQVAGLKTFLGKNYPELICVDVICHGTPPAKLWRKYLNYLENRYGAKANSVSFRHKRSGWRKFGMQIETNESKTYYCDLDQDTFLQLFLNNCCLRESCYQCKVKETGSGADLTLGDFWGVEKCDPSLENALGVSLVLIHTKVGKNLLEKVMPALQGKAIPAKSAIKWNTAYLCSVRRPVSRDRFFKDIDCMHWESVANKYKHGSLYSRLRKAISKSPFGLIIKATIYCAKAGGG